MALVLADRVEQVTRTTGLADLTLAEVLRGRQSFQSVTANGDTVIYVLEDAEGMAWEIGEGTVIHGAETVLQRTTIRQSSNSDAKISLSAGTHRVFLAADSQYLTDIVNQTDVNDAIAAHEAEADPHPQYTTEAEASAAAPVQSVNGTTGTVSLDASDVGATPASHVGTGSTQHANATTTVSGFMSGADKTKLDGVEAGATADQSAAEVPYGNATSGLAATQVQAAIDEVDGDLDAHLASSSAHAAAAITSTSGNSVQQELTQRIGVISIAVAGSDVTLTDQQVSAQVIELTGTLTANISIIVPDTARLYTFVNSTSGSFTVTVKTSAGTGVVVPQNQNRVLRSNGTDVVAIFSDEQAYVGNSVIADGSATFTNANNNISLSGIGANVEVGDVIEVSGSASNNNEYTVEVITDNDNVVVNKSHAGGATTKSLTDETASISVKLLCKWYLAPLGLGQGWVDVTSSRTNNVAYTNSTNRSIQASAKVVRVGTSALELIVDGLRVSLYDLDDAGGGSAATVMALVPKDSSYTYNAISGTLTEVRELR